MYYVLTGAFKVWGLEGAGDFSKAYLTFCRAEHAYILPNNKSVVVVVVVTVFSY